MKTILVWTLLFSGANILPAAAGNQILLRNFDPADGTPQTLAADGQGHLLVVSILPAGTEQATRVVELDLQGARLASLDIPQLEYPTAAVTDALGNLVVVGQNPAYQGTVWKVDPQLHNAVLLKSLPGAIEAVTTDATLNIYLTGITSSTSFPLTPDAYQSTPPLADHFGTAGFAFLTKISPGGDKLIYSTYFGSSNTTCLGGSFCVGKFGVTTGTAIALDASGAVIIAGNTTASDLPATPGALATTCTCEYNYAYGTGITSGFMAKFQPGAAKSLLWATYLNGKNSGPISVTVDSLASDAGGNPIAGGSGPPDLPVTPGAFQSSPPAANPASPFLLMLNSTGTTVVWGTYYGGGAGAVESLLVDAQGEVLFGGSTNGFGTFVARLSGGGGSPVEAWAGPTAEGLALALTSSGGFAAVYASGALWIETASTGPSLLAVANSASGRYSNTLAGAELVTLYFAGIGPQTPVAGQVQNGAFTTSLGGSQVLFDGVAAPLLYAGSTQINAIVPHLVGPSAHIQVLTPTGTIDGPTVPVPGNPVPGIFLDSQTGTAAALNHDGSINSADNPAKSGSIVTVYATGGGANYFPDGSLVPIDVFDSPASVWAVDNQSQRSLEVQFAGDAPGLVTGVMQVNFLLPDPLPPGDRFAFSLIIGGASTGSQIFVAP